MTQKAKFLSSLFIEELGDGRLVRLERPFMYYSKILDQIITIPVNFICDYESVPLIRSNSKRAGLLHDYFSRKDSIPVVSKQMAASIYSEAQKCKDQSLNIKWYLKIFKFCARHTKTIVVRIAPCYFHKFFVVATLKELKYNCIN